MDFVLAIRSGFLISTLEDEFQGHNNPNRALTLFHVVEIRNADIYSQASKVNLSMRYTEILFLDQHLVGLIELYGSFLKVYHQGVGY